MQRIDESKGDSSFLGANTTINHDNSISVEVPRATSNHRPDVMKGSSSANKKPKGNYFESPARESIGDNLPSVNVKKANNYGT